MATIKESIRSEFDKRALHEALDPTVKRAIEDALGTQEFYPLTPTANQDSVNIEAFGNTYKVEYTKSDANEYYDINVIKHTIVDVEAELEGEVEAVEP